MAKEILWFCNYTGSNISLEQVCKEIGKHVFNSEAIPVDLIRNNLRNGMTRTSFAQTDAKDGFSRCDLELSMNMDNITVQKCSFTNVVFYVVKYDSLEKVVDYLSVKELKKNGTIWRGTIKCDDGRKKTVVIKLWQDRYFIAVDITKEFVELNGKMYEGIIE
jgi:hypothetical protein